MIEEWKNVPCCVKFNEDILAVIKHDFFKLLSDEGKDALVLRLGNRLALEFGSELVVKVLLDPVLHSSSRNLLALVIRVLELLLQVLHNKAGPLGFLEVKSLAVVTELDGVNPNKVDLGLEFLGDWFDFCKFGVFAFVGGVEEEVCKGLLALSVDSVVVTVDFVNDGDGEFCKPFRNVFGCGGGNWVRVFDTGSIEGAVYDEGRGRDAERGEDLGIRRLAKEVVVAVGIGGLGELDSQGV